MPDAPAKEPCYIVILSLHAKTDYEPLYKLLKSYTTWASLLGNAAWAIVTAKTAAQLRDDIVPLIGETDRVLVVKSAGVGAWRNFPNSSDWLKKYL